MIRLVKIAAALASGLLIFLVAMDNVIDYGTNFDVVQHIMSMDMLPPTPLKWRAIASPALHGLFYWIIILSEWISAILTLAGVWIMWRARGGTAAAFNASKAMAVTGLMVGLLLYLFGFMAVGGEWFQMWRAGAYDMQQAAFRFIGCIGVIVIFISLADVEVG